MFSSQKWEFLDYYIVKLYTSDQEGTVEELAHILEIIAAAGTTTYRFSACQIFNN